jgi:hypothetical protein
VVATRTAEGRQRLIVVPDFFDEAAELRAGFDERFGALAGGNRNRFVWDYWHVPGQYTYLRTFPEAALPVQPYRRLLQRLRNWGGDHLGCPRVMNPWLSFFVDGCVQELHTDVPHGPWAYVFSLTAWDSRSFNGGETMLLRSEVLDYWSSLDSQGSASGDFLELVPPRFNQLTLFDPRIPHGVRRVQGTWDPLASRLILHGWFREPEVVMSDSLAEVLPRQMVDSVLARLSEKLAPFGSLQGLVTARVELNPNGEPSRVSILTNTLMSAKRRPEDAAAAAARIREVLGDQKFPPAPPEAWFIAPVRLP